MEDSKYVVFKRGELEEWKHTFGLGAMPEPVEDAVVIRRQDVFAPPALDAYSNAITIALEISDLPRPDLQAIADYFHEQACEAWQTDRKIPD